MFPAGILAVTDQSPGLTAYSVCFQPLIGFHTSFPILVTDVVSVIAAYLPYGPHDAFAALTLQEKCDG